MCPMRCLINPCFVCETFQPSTRWFVLKIAAIGPSATLARLPPQNRYHSRRVITVSSQANGTRWQSCNASGGSVASAWRGVPTPSGPISITKRLANAGALSRALRRSSGSDKTLRTPSITLAIWSCRALLAFVASSILNLDWRLRSRTLLYFPCN